MWLAILVISLAAVVIGAVQIPWVPKDDALPAILISFGVRFMLVATMFIIMLSRSKRLVVVTAGDLQVGNRRFGDQVSSIGFEGKPLRGTGRHRFTTTDWVMVIELRTGVRVRWSIAQGDGAEGKFVELVEAMQRVYRDGALAASRPDA